MKNQNLAAFLIDMQPIIMGVNASSCIMETSLSAINKGLKIITSEGLIDNLSSVPLPNIYSRYEQNSQFYNTWGKMLYFEETKS